MRTRRAISVLLISATLGQSGFAQGDPLSAIDWLSQPATALSPNETVPSLAGQRLPQQPSSGQSAAQQSATRAPSQKNDEPAIAETAISPGVETVVLGAPGRSAVGLLNPARVGLPSDLWKKSNADLLIELVDQIDLSVPSLARLMQVLLLAEADGPIGDGNAFLAARLKRLFDIGAVESSQALLERAGIDDPVLFAQWSELALLNGSGTHMCQTLGDKPELSQDVVLKIYCTAQMGDWNRAATVLQTASALGDLKPRQAQLMAQFLDPDLAESQPVPLPPVRPSALTYRIYEAVGDPLPSLSLPLPFATLDLNGDNGWKPQLEAAERLARSGALPPNQLLGIYSLREPAASGGIWDRIEAFQTFENTLKTGPDSRVGTALEDIWPQMASAGLTVTFAELFAENLSKRDLKGRAKRITERMIFLSPDYENLGPAHVSDTAEGRFLTAIAMGIEPTEPYPDLPHAATVAAAFSGQAAPDSLIEQAHDGKIGEVILQSIALFSIGAEGKSRALGESLATFRALGLEDIARRAALELMLLDAEHARR